MKDSYAVEVIYRNVLTQASKNYAGEKVELAKDDWDVILALLSREVANRRLMEVGLKQI